MWQSEDDILKDIALINDFGVSGDAEPQRILFSTGRGSKITIKAKNPEKFIDPRTGEVVEIDDSELSFTDNLFSGRGRGKHLGHWVKKFQLQEQLRLARPLGSGDEAIESYCRRNRPKTNSVSTSDSDADSSIPGIVYNSERPTPRLKGRRNSSSQSNALISSLLSKIKVGSSEEITSSSNTEYDSSKSTAMGDSFQNEWGKPFETNEEEEYEQTSDSCDEYPTKKNSSQISETDSKEDRMYITDTEFVTSDESADPYSENFPPLRPRH